ncbi:DUF2516 family protein [Corynebacterium qintianiae]|uniref:DUF2516 family protein n=1 Tax=Corynebacterium qintianiae TaxID=2709392 RepID=A0A7T0PFF9_9CORY|nr:DUF2516 family protein [Corynebacterium qintianiae]QPK84211.1 DUF2516 family protein [Corynebacterium qintianiae]
MDLDTLGLVGYILNVPSIARNILFLAIGIAGIVGAFFAAMTRDDAYDAAGRQNKWAWVAIVGVSGIVCLLRFPLVAWFGAVAIGIYYFDVRPQLNNIIRGNYGW